MQLYELSKKSPVVDTLRLKEAISGVIDQRGKIARLMKQGDVTQLRRGLYALRRDLNPMGYAGAIYGPSYISYETALAWHGLIPERVDEILSATLKRPANFENSFGIFRYRHVPAAIYAIGITMIRDSDLPILMASPTKSLCDSIAREGGLRTMQGVLNWIRGMRIEEPLELDETELRLCADNYGRNAVKVLAKAAEKYHWLAR